MMEAGMLDEEDGAAETAIGFTDRFVQAGVSRLDALFGAGYAKENPQALAAYVGACASNLNAFMNAAMALHEDESFGEALAAYQDELLTAPAPKTRGRRR